VKAGTMKYSSMHVMKRIVSWSLLALTALYIVTGFGITAFRTVTPATFGLLGKALSFRVHDALWAPFLVLLALHLVFRFLASSDRKEKKETAQ